MSRRKNNADAISLSNQGLDRLVNDLLMSNDSGGFHQDYLRAKKQVGVIASSVEVFKLLYLGHKTTKTFLVH